ncbi:efflux RND transporter periplasmic adaptor subunit [Xanthomonas sp. AmX2]|uniref:efflux RND transporter periplasmic adaptor subunit n=1 Tax=Xanthomonas sp. TaxID=29446 RepID=UPI00197F9854|nr:efflux RND transporter periplasmic adaptor subunit [Xanthomonas sp.]MBN6150014.1 efflux RND transporter periplasmic adaptor subunit [Xanthomonas sp.]
MAPLRHRYAVARVRAGGVHPGSGRRRLRGRGQLWFICLIGALAAGAAVLASIVVAQPGPQPPVPHADPAADAAPMAMTITTARAAYQSWRETLRASGAIVPWQESALGAPLGGLRVASVDAQVGDRVRRGQVLARFDDALLQAEAHRLQAALAQAQAQAAQAARDAERAVKLRASGALSEQSILQSLTQAESAAAAVRSAQASLRAKQVEIAYAVLRAPDDGVISERTATLGAVPEQGQPLFRLIRQQRLEWRGEVGARQIAQILPGREVVLALPDGSRAVATVRQAAPTLGTDSRMGLVYADLRPGSGARAGMYVEGEIAQATSAALVVPAAAVVIRDGRSFVFEISAQGGTGKASARAVTVGRRQGRSVEIVSGLREGAHVAELGAGFLADGDRVRIGTNAVASAVPGGGVEAVAP